MIYMDISIVRHLVSMDTRTLDIVTPVNKPSDGRLPSFDQTPSIGRQSKPLQNVNLVSLGEFHDITYCI
jgi:hypothetical protein